MSGGNQMLAVLKDIYRETVATPTEMVSAIKILIVHINTFISWLSVTVTGSISITSSGLASILSAINTENAVHSTHNVNSSAFNIIHVNTPLSNHLSMNAEKRHLLKVSIPE